MNRKLISRAISNIDDSFIAQTMSPPVAKADRAPERTMKMGKYENRKSGVRSRRLAALVLAACLVFALVMTAYAFNFLGIREMLHRRGEDLPEEAYGYIQEHGQAIDSQVWRCEVTESLCDEKNIYITISVTTPGEYILVPTDATPEHSVSVIGLTGEQTLGEYAAEQNKKLLLVGAGISDSESLGITTCSQTFESTSAQEITILLHAKKTASASIHEVTCVVTGLEENVILTHSMPITLVEAPSDGSVRYVPATSDAIPGLTVGEAIVTETPLGISIRIRETITDEEAFRNIMKVEIDGIEYSEGGSVLEDDGNWYFTIPRGQGTLSDTLTVRFLDWNKQPIGTVVFQEK